MALLKRQDAATGATGKNLFYRGELSEISVSSLLLDAKEERLSGMLTLTQGTVRKVVHLHDGQLVYARSSLRKETLGELLLGKGLIQPAENLAALRHSRAHKVPYSEVLFRLGVMRQDRIAEEMTDGVRQRIETCLIWRNGSWMFIGDEGAADVVPTCQLETLEVIFSGLQRYFNMEETLLELAGKEQRPLELLHRCLVYRGAFVEAFGSTLLHAAAAGRTLGELMKTPSMEPEQAAVQISVLLHTDMARVRAVKGEPAAEVSEELRARHHRETAPVDLSDVALSSTEMFDPAEELDEAFFDEDLTPIVDPPDSEDTLLDFREDEPTPVVDTPILGGATQEVSEPVKVPQPEPALEVEPEPAAEPEPEADPEPEPEAEPEPEPEPAEEPKDSSPELRPQPDPGHVPELASELEGFGDPAPPPPAGTSWGLLALSFVLGVAAASAFFLIFRPCQTAAPTVSGSGIAPAAAAHREARVPAPDAGQAQVARVEPAAATRDAAVPETKAEPAPEAKAEPVPETKDAPAPETRAEPAPETRVEPAPASDQPPATAAGLVVAAAIKPCLEVNPTRTRLISASMSAAGRIRRVYVAKLPGKTPKGLHRCIKGNLQEP